MIKMLSKILLECPLFLAARDKIMSDMDEIFKSEEMLASFPVFFENDQDDHLDSYSLDSLVKFQICDE